MAPVAAGLAWAALAPEFPILLGQNKICILWVNLKLGFFKNRACNLPCILWEGIMKEEKQRL